MHLTSRKTLRIPSITVITDTVDEDQCKAESLLVINLEYYAHSRLVY